MKCPVCNSTFEPTPEEENNSRPWGVKLCSIECWKKSHKNQSPEGHRWEYHVGERTPVQAPGGSLGNLDHSKFNFDRRKHRRVKPSHVGRALDDLFK